MKKFSLQLLICCFCLLSYWYGQAQEVYRGLKQTIDMTIDKLGNATMDVAMTLNAAQWDNFKKTVGDNVSLLKRSMEKALPKYYLTDFNYSEQPMDRSYHVKFKALGICSMNKDGVWEAKLDTKKPDITKLSDNAFLMTEDVLTNGMLVQQTIKLYLPPVAKGAKVAKDTFGKAEITYTMGQDMMSMSLTLLGVLLLLLGGWFYYRSFQMQKNRQTQPLVRQMQTSLAGEPKI
jgi:hypothetical protein